MRDGWLGSREWAYRWSLDDEVVKGTGLCTAPGGSEGRGKWGWLGWLCPPTPPLQSHPHSPGGKRLLSGSQGPSLPPTHCFSPCAPHTFCILLRSPTWAEPRAALRKGPWRPHRRAARTGPSALQPLQASLAWAPSRCSNLGSEVGRSAQQGGFQT